MNRLQEIEARLAELAIEIRSENSDLDAIEVEIKALKEERQAILDKAEKRKAMLDGIANLDGANVIAKFEDEGEKRSMEFTRETVFKTPEYRSAWAKSLMYQPLNETEKRALGVALTTTATTYVGATAQADGVNNGGLFIPEEVNLALMEELSLASPIFADVAKTAVNGLIKFPYRVDGTGAEAKTEGVANADGQVQWAELTLTILEVSETIRVSWRLEAMSVDGFIDYIVTELAEQIKEKVLTEGIYGNGTNTLTGITVNAIDGSYTIGESTGEVVDILAAIEAGLKLLPKKKKVGAKIYVAQDIIETVAFLRDANGNFVYNPINGGGINSIATYKVEVDPYLNAGDFIIGNPSKFYRFNTNESLQVVKDVSGKNRINDYTGFMLVSGAPQPNSFVYGKKS